MSRSTGQFLRVSTAGEPYRAWLPAELPPEPPLQFDTARLNRLERANRELGRLDAITDLLPDPSRLLYSFVRKEAVLSSQIEGTQSSLSDLLIHELAEAPGTPTSDVVEVSSYLRALEHGQRRLQESFPLCLRLIRELHAQLLAHGRGAHKMPGEFRRSAVWIGGTRPGNAHFVPPPAEHLDDCLGALERYLHTTDEQMPALVRAALVHVQFETIHPFLDGNGRVGRLLITLMLMQAGVLKAPLLYLSLYFKANRADYYDNLQRVRTHGDWEAWVDYFLLAVEVSAGEALRDAKRILALFEADALKLKAQGRKAAGLLALHQHFTERPITRVATAVAATGINRTSVQRNLEEMKAQGMVSELTGQRRNRLYAYQPYLDILSEGTEPL